MTVSIRLLKRDIELIYKFQAWCNLKNLKQFSADDFRNYLTELKKELKDPAHDTGRIFRTMLVIDIAQKVGWTPSKHPENHGRAIRLYVWKRQ